MKETRKKEEIMGKEKEKNINTYFNRPYHVWPLPSHEQESCYADEDEQRLHKARIFNEAVDISCAKVHEWKATLKERERKNEIRKLIWVWHEISCFTDNINIGRTHRMVLIYLNMNTNNTNV